MLITPNAERRLQRLRAPHLVLAAPLAGAAAPSMVRHWDDLAGAVCDRLDRLAEHGSDAALCDGVHECAAALRQLHACIAVERNGWRRPTVQALARRTLHLAP
jgi:hypothetical protein